MKLVSRSQWGAQPSRYDLVYIASTKGTKVHYEGTPVPTSLVDHHEQCDDRMRALQASHLANTKEDYSDIAYNFVVCPHGSVYEGRGLHRKTAANGNQPLNIAHYSVCGMVGSEGYIHPTDAQLAGIRDAIDYLRAEGGAGPEIKGHRDGYATSCPGEPLYAWVQAGAPRPSAPKPPVGSSSAPGATSKPAVSLANVVAAARRDPAAPQGSAAHRADVLLVERALVAEQLLDRQWADGSYGTKTVAAYQKWQRRCGFTSPADADGIPGRTTLTKLGKAHGFTVKA